MAIVKLNMWKIKIFVPLRLDSGSQCIRPSTHPDLVPVTPGPLGLL